MNTEILLRQVDPARDAEIPGPDSPEGVRIRVQAMSRSLADGPTPDPRARRKVGISIGTLVAVAATVALLVVLLPASVGPLNSKASAALARLAAQAATVPTSLGAGQYAYTEVEGPVSTIGESTGPRGPSFTEYLTGTVQTWVAADGSGRRVRTTDPTPHFFTAADRVAWVAAGSPPAVVPPGQLTTVQVFGASTASEVNGPIPLYNVTGLPTDSTTLTQILDNENQGDQSLGTLPAGIKSLDFASSCSTAACTLFERAVALLQGPDIGATPALRQALFEVLATVPGVELLGTTTDQAGQSGVGLALVQRQPAGTEIVQCATAPQGSVRSTGPDSIVVSPNSQDTTITKTVKEFYPASSTTFSIVVDPQTTSLLSSQESFSPLIQGASSAPCGQASKTSQTTEVGPNWQDVVSSGVVNSDTAVPIATSK
jgi:hypothetical protein